MKKILVSIFSDERGSLSSKRIIAILCVLAIIVSHFLTLFIKTLVIDKNLINALVTICVAAMGSTTMDKFSAIIPGKKEEQDTK